MPIALDQVRPWSVLSRLGAGDRFFVKTDSGHVCQVGTTVPENCDPHELVNVITEAPQPTPWQRLKNCLSSL